MYSTIQTAEDFGIDVKWAISRRKEYLNQRVTELKNGQQSVLQLFSGNNELSRFLLLDSMKYLNNELKKCEMELNFKNAGKGEWITQADIERARSYPIENLLHNVRNGKTHCVSGGHGDRHPSMDIRNNFAYCYSCGWHGDVIAVCMQVNGVNFITAVKTLSA